MSDDIENLSRGALVAALRAEREEVARLTALAESNWRSLEREAWEHARTLTDYTRTPVYGEPRTGQPLSEGEARRYEAAVERGLRKRAEDQCDAAVARAEAAEAAIAAVWALCDDVAVGLSYGCTCYGDEHIDGACHYGQPMAWSLDPNVIRRALDTGATLDEANLPHYESGFDGGFCRCGNDWPCAGPDTGATP